MQTPKLWKVANRLVGITTQSLANDLQSFLIVVKGLPADVVWEHRLGTPIKTAPAVSGNKLFVHDHAGNLWCFTD